MCNSDSKGDRRRYTKAGNIHDEKGGFHIVELNSPINMDGKMFIVIILALLAIAAWYVYRRDKRQERKRLREEKAIDEERDEKRLKKLQLAKKIHALEDDGVEEIPRSSLRHPPLELDQLAPLLQCLRQLAAQPLPTAYPMPSSSALPALPPIAPGASQPPQPYPVSLSAFSAPPPSPTTRANPPSHASSPSAFTTAPSTPYSPRSEIVARVHATDADPGPSRSVKFSDTPLKLSSPVARAQDWIPVAYDSDA